MPLTPAPFGPEWSAALRRCTEEELRAWVELALAACDEADAIALAQFRRDPEVSIKADRSLVTEADTAVERAIRARIGTAYPDHGLVGEEYGTEAGDARTRWYIDPIDGTSNFVRGVPLFATLLAVEHDGELQAAVISAPALRERWWAWRGGGAWAAGSEGLRRIRTSSVTALAETHLLYGSGRDLMASEAAPGFGALLDAVWRDRGFGDFWGWVLVAEGAGDAMVDVGLKPWDAAAPTLLVEEAGGRFTDFEGRRAINAQTFLATNGHLHDEVLEQLRSARGGASTP